MNDDETKEMKARYLQQWEKEVHIITVSKRFYNGLILKVEPNCLIVLDRKLGRIPLFFQEILILEPFQRRGNHD